MTTKIAVKNLQFQNMQSFFIFSWLFLSHQVLSLFSLLYGESEEKKNTIFSPHLAFIAFSEKKSVRKTVKSLERSSVSSDLFPFHQTDTFFTYFCVIQVLNFNHSTLDKYSRP